MRYIILFATIILSSNIVYSQSNYTYQTSKYICHNRDRAGYWSNEQVGYANILIVLDLDNDIITFNSTNSKFVYHIMSSYKKNNYPYTYFVYECMQINVPFTIVITNDNENGSQTITLENIQTRITYNVTFLGKY
jgi:hypothetical protein